MNLNEAKMNSVKSFHPLFALKRGPSMDFLIFGQYIVVENNHTVLGSSDDFSLLCRSLLNPWQYLAADITEEDSFWAMGLSFHSGEPIHIKAIEKIAQRYQISEADLICPRDFPIHWETTARLRLNNVRPRRLHHPSSGQHMLFLASCVHHQIERKDYWSPNHPVQKKLFSSIGKVVKAPVQIATDNCGLPTFYMQATQLCHLWQNLAQSKHPNTQLLKQLWLRSPQLVGGTNRLDHDITSVCSGHALAKEGADGLLLVQNLPTEDEKPLTILIKLSSGFHKTHLMLALKAVLEKIPLKGKAFTELEQHLEQKTKDWLDDSVRLVSLL